MIQEIGKDDDNPTLYVRNDIYYMIKNDDKADKNKSFQGYKSPVKVFVAVTSSSTNLLTIFFLKIVKLRIL